MLANKSLGELMKESKLTAKAADFISHGIAMIGADSPALAAVRRIQLYAKSIGRYSDSAFLACYYGTAEVLNSNPCATLPQIEKQLLPT